MWNPFHRATEECTAVRDHLDAANLSDMPQHLTAHLASCANCRSAAEDFALNRALLQNLSRQQPGPWFVPRVMAAIAVQEEKLSRTLETWRAVPKLAARLTWITAIALLFGTAWLYESPRFANSSASLDDSVESVFGISSRPAPPATNDDVFVSLVEQ